MTVGAERCISLQAVDNVWCREEARDVMSRRPVGVLMGIVVGLLVAGCAQVPVASDRPAELANMSSDEFGCVLVFGSEESVVGPFSEPGESFAYEPNDWTSFEVYRTFAGMAFEWEYGYSTGKNSHFLDDLPEDGVLAFEEYRDQGHPGYVLTCWQGEA